MIATARSESGTRCSLLPFIRPAGTVHILAVKSISAHVAPTVSPVRAAVRIVNSRAFAETPSRLRNSMMKSLICVNGRAG